MIARNYCAVAHTSEETDRNDVEAKVGRKLTMYYPTKVGAEPECGGKQATSHYGRLNKQRQISSKLTSPAMPLGKSEYLPTTWTTFYCEWCEVNE